MASAGWASAAWTPCAVTVSPLGPSRLGDQSTESDAEHGLPEAQWHPVHSSHQSCNGYFSALFLNWFFQQRPYHTIHVLRHTKAPVDFIIGCDVLRALRINIQSPSQSKPVSKPSAPLQPPTLKPPPTPTRSKPLSPAPTSTTTTRANFDRQLVATSLQDLLKTFEQSKPFKRRALTEAFKSLTPLFPTNRRSEWNNLASTLPQHSVAVSVLRHLTSNLGSILAQGISQDSTLRALVSTEDGGM